MDTGLKDKTLKHCSDERQEEGDKSKNKSKNLKRERDKRSHKGDLKKLGKKKTVGRVGGRKGVKGSREKRYTLSPRLLYLVVTRALGPPRP